MRLAWCAALLASVCAAGAQAAPLDCETLRAEIEQKIQSQGVANYTLEVVDNAEVKDPAMVVGTCANGTRKVIYQKSND